MLAIFGALVASVVPVLVPLAEKLFPNTGTPTGAAKHGWVTAAVNDVLDNLVQYIPSWLKPALPELQKLIDDAIQAELSKIDP